MANEIAKVSNPYGAIAPANADSQSAIATIAAGASSSEVQIAQAKAQAESFASIMAAKNWPRDERKSADRLLISCQRPSLAEQAVYVYSRGGQNITGPSIRLAEAAARAWGNLKYGFKVTASDNLHSEVTCYAYDMESNIPVERSFEVSHIRHTKNGDKLLTDPRDIYEKVANESMRRVRACILECIPGDIIESAVEQCEATLKASADITPATLKKLVDAFAQVGVSKTQIEARIQRRIDDIAPAQVVDLRKIFTSLKDGMSKVEDWFDVKIVDTSATPAAAPAHAKKKPTIAEVAAKAAAKAKEPEPAEDYPEPPADRQPPPDLPYTDEGVEDIPDTL